MKIEFKKIKENHSGVPSFDSTTGQWKIECRILINTNAVTLIEPETERKGLSKLNFDSINLSIFVLGSYDEIKEKFMEEWEQKKPNA